MGGDCSILKALLKLTSLLTFWACEASNLLSYCFVEQIPENPDLVLAEFGK
jgi:hypothetical protein